MSDNSTEFIFHSFPADNIQTLNIVCKNYKVNISEGAGEEITISYYNNRFRKLALRSGSKGICLEEKMTVTFYDILRLIELMGSNELNITLPANCSNLNITVETGVTDIAVDEIAANSIRLLSASGHIRVRNACVDRELCAHSTSGRVSCVLAGAEEDFDIDCRAERMDVRQPYYPANHSAARKIVLRSNMYVPDLTFTGERPK